MCIDILGPKDLNSFQLKYISQKWDLPLELLPGGGVYLCKDIILYLMLHSTFYHRIQFLQLKYHFDIYWPQTEIYWYIPQIAVMGPAGKLIAIIYETVSL